MTSHHFIALACLLLVTSSCQKKGEIAHYRVKKSTPAAQQNQSTSATSVKNRYQWTLPSGWSAKPASGMRLATIIIPVSDHKTIEASITEFGGDLSGNINRWRRQVSLPPLSAAEIPPTLTPLQTQLGKGHITLISNPDSPEKALLAALIPRPSGTTVFIKATGTTAELTSIQPTFSTFVQSLTTHE